VIVTEWNIGFLKNRTSQNIGLTLRGSWVGVAERCLRLTSAHALQVLRLGAVDTEEGAAAEEATVVVVAADTGKKSYPAVGP
jgi:hypothetical protein